MLKNKEQAVSMKENKQANHGALDDAKAFPNSGNGTKAFISSDTEAKEKKRGGSVIMLCLLAMFIALQYVTEYVLMIQVTNSNRISFTSILRAVTGYTFGPLGAVVSGAADVLGSFLVFGGNIIIGVTVTRMIQGLINGLLLWKKFTAKRIILTAILDNIILGCFVNQFFVLRFYGSPYKLAAIAPKIVVSCITCVIEIVVLLAIRKVLRSIINKTMYNQGVWSPNQKSDNE